MIATLDPSPALQRVSSEEAAPSKARTKEELLRSVSASRLGTWLQCRLKFKFRYLDGIAKPPTPALHVGSVIHTVLQQWSLARWRRAPLDDTTLVAIFDHAWRVWQEEQEIAWEGEEDATKASALVTLKTYLRETPIPQDEKPEAVEVGVEMDLASHGLPMLVGILDLIRKGGRIVDFKTTGKTPIPEMLLTPPRPRLRPMRCSTGRPRSGGNRALSCITWSGSKRPKSSCRRPARRRNGRSPGFSTSRRAASGAWKPRTSCPRRDSPAPPANSSRNVEHGGDGIGPLHQFGWSGQAPRLASDHSREPHWKNLASLRALRMRFWGKSERLWRKWL